MIVLLAAGSNAHGQLANRSNEDAHYFGPAHFGSSSCLPPLRRIAQLVSGANHTIVSLALSTIDDHDSSVQLWCCGDGSKGQLGPTPRVNINSLEFHPMQLPLERCGFPQYYPRLVAAAWETTFVVISSVDKDKPDVILSMGTNDWGNLGDGGSPEVESGIHVVKLDHLSSHDEMMTVRIESITAGPHHILVYARFSLSDGSTEDIVAGWGTSRHGQLGSSLTTPFQILPQVINIPIAPCSIRTIAMGSRHTVFLPNSGTLLGMGSDRKGQLRDIEELRDVREVSCTWNGTFAVADGKNPGVYSTGSHENGQLGRLVTHAKSIGRVHVPEQLKSSHIRHIACGSEHVLCVVSMGEGGRDEVWGWGWNEHGNLGIGIPEDVPIPRRVWPSDSCADFPWARERLALSKVVGIWAGCGTSWIALEI
jgi:protein ATS1